jgi:hypothetical protein
MNHVDDLIEPRPKQILLPAVPQKIMGILRERKKPMGTFVQGTPLRQFEGLWSFWICDGLAFLASRNRRGAV